MAGMIDVHQHVLYGVDDGAQTIRDSIRMLQMAQDDGVTHIFATSHAVPSMAMFPLERYYDHLESLNEAIRARGLAISVYDGCEVFYSDIAARQLEEERLPTLAGSRFVLIEFDPTSTFEMISDAVRRLTNIGLIPVIAHCERYEALVKNTRRTMDLRQRARMRIQINASTMIRRPPLAVRHFRDALMKANLVDYVASDAHGVSMRPPNLGDAFDAIAHKYGSEKAHLVTWRNQTEILEGVR